MQKSDLIPGTILLLEDTPDHTTMKHKMIKLGQMAKGSSSAFVHALIWVQNPKNTGEQEIAEASGSGTVRCSNLKPGSYAAFVPLDANLGDWAAQVAMMWAVDGKITYGKAKALNSIVHSGGYGSNAQARAAQYAAVAFENPPSGGSGALQNMFCSEFVVAVYQAAQQQTGSKTLIKLDARHTTPALLIDWLSARPDFTRGSLTV
jgi:hypothetical protein